MRVYNQRGEMCAFNCDLNIHWSRASRETCPPWWCYCDNTPWCIVYFSTCWQISSWVITCLLIGCFVLCLSCMKECAVNYWSLLNLLLIAWLIIYQQSALRLV